MTIKLKYKDIKPLRDSKILEQNGKCLLCEHPIEAPCLDHNHKTGIIRGVLCRGCNSMLGKIENSIAICKMSPTKLSNFLNNVDDYIKHTSSYYIHPTYKK